MCSQEVRWPGVGHRRDAGGWLAIVHTLATIASSASILIAFARLPTAESSRPWLYHPRSTMKFILLAFALILDSAQAQPAAMIRDIE